MNDDTIITINGVDYYAPSDYVDYIVVSGNTIYNTSNNTITLYGSLREYGDSRSGYPRITLQPYYKGYITQSYNSSGSTLVVNSYSVKTKSFTDSYLLSVVAILVLILIFFKRS